MHGPKDSSPKSAPSRDVEIPHDTDETSSGEPELDIDIDDRNEGREHGADSDQLSERAQP